MRPNLQSVGDGYARSNIPLTLGILAAMTTCFLLSMSANLGRALFENGAFVAPGSWMQPWRVFTFPLLYLFPDIIGLLFNGLALWWIGGSLERSWGTRTFAIFVALACIVTAVSMSLGAWIVGATLPLSSWLLGSALLMAWCMLNPEQSILLYGIVPILAKWIAVATVLIVFFIHAGMHPVLGFFALGGCVFAWWWARSRRWNEATVATYATAPRYDTFSDTSPQAARRRAAAVTKKVARPLDDRKTWRDYNPFEIRKRKKRIEQFERLMKDD